MEDIIQFLDSLVASSGSLADDRETILHFLNPKAKKVVEGFDFDAALQQFSQWFLALLAEEPPPRRTRALNFGLMETKGGAQLCVYGAKRYDAEDSDWACASDWLPDGRYAPLEAFPKLWSPLRRTGAEPWVVSQGVAIVLIRAFFAAHWAEFQKSSGLKRVYVTTGFEDGDLYIVPTPIAPRTS